MRAPKPVTMWAAVVKGERSEWINPYAIGWVRRDAKAAYREYIGHERADAHIKAKRVRFVRVIVAAQEEQ